MATFDAACTNESIEEVDLKGSSPHEMAAETEWHILDNHRRTLSFSGVHPVGISVRGLGVEVGVAASFADTLGAKFTKSKVGDVEGGVVGGGQTKKILKDISADFPSGTLTAIIGGSGSGKVRLRLCELHSTGLTHPSTPSSDRLPSSTSSLIACVDQTSLSPEAHDTMGLRTFLR